MSQRQENGHCFSHKCFQNKICDIITKFWGNGSFVDVSLICEGEVIKAHRLILSIFSPFFENILHSTTNPDIVFTDIPKTDLLLLLEYMYKGSVTVPENDLSSLLRTAEKLQIMGLSDEEVHTQDDLATPNLSAVLDVNNVNILGGVALEHSVVNGHSTPVHCSVKVEVSDNYIKSNDTTTPSNLDFDESTSQNQGSIENHTSPITEKRSADKAANNSIKTTKKSLQRSSTKQCSPHREVTESTKRVINPFARAPRRQSDSDSTVYDCNLSLPSTSTKTLKKECDIPASLSDKDSDVEFIEHNPTIIDVDIQVNSLGISKSPRSSKEKSKALGEIELTSDESEVMSFKSKRMKKNPIAVQHKKKDLREGTVVDQPGASSNSVRQKKSVVGEKKEPIRGFIAMRYKDLENFCMICSRNKKNIRFHVQKHDSKKEVYKCEDCPTQFFYPDTLARHKCKTND